MRRTLFFTAIFCLAPLQSFAFTRLEPGQIRSYSVDVNMDTLSNNYLHGRYRFVNTLQFKLPDSSKKETITVLSTNEEAGTSEKIQRVQVSYQSKSPWIIGTTTLFQIDDSGNIIKTIASKTCDDSEKNSFPPETVAGLKQRAVILNLGCSMVAQDFTDAANHALKFNIQVIAPTYLEMDEQFRILGIYSDSQDTQRATLTIIAGSWDDSRTYNQDAVSIAGTVPYTQDCTKAGESVAIDALPIGETYKISQREICYPLRKGGFSRIVVPLHNIAHDPFTQEALDSLLTGPKYESVETVEHGINYSHMETTDGKYAGHLAGAPLFSLSQTAEANCHGYAIWAATRGRNLQLPTDATWLEGSLLRNYSTNSYDPVGWHAYSTAAAHGSYPFQTILFDRFGKVLEFFPNSLSRIRGEDAVMHDPRLREGDLITFLDNGQYVHSGILVYEPGHKEFWIESKVSEGPVVVTPLQNILSTYQATVRVEVYRLLP